MLDEKYKFLGGREGKACNQWMATDSRTSSNKQHLDLEPQTTGWSGDSFKAVRGNP